MKISQVAAQLYTVRDHCKTAVDFANTMRRLRGIGYTAVQVSGIGPIPEEEVVRILDGEGLTCCATHEPSAVVRWEPEKVVERLQKLGCKYTAYPSPHGVDFTKEEDVITLAKDLDNAGAVLREAGLVLAYHNHGFEFVPFRGRPALEYIYDSTDPLNLVSEIDTYWIHYGGGDSVAWCRRMAGRMPLLHLKDYIFTPDNAPTFAEIGRGTLPFGDIIEEAENGGCEWFIVEQDTCDGDPVDSLRMSFNHIRDNLCEA